MNTFYHLWCGWTEVFSYKFQQNGERSSMLIPPVVFLQLRFSSSWFSFIHRNSLSLFKISNETNQNGWDLLKIVNKVTMYEQTQYNCNILEKSVYLMMPLSYRLSGKQIKSFQIFSGIILSWNEFHFEIFHNIGLSLHFDSIFRLRNIYTYKIMSLYF